ncbi:hypothetical protein RRG08_040057 [Elysia crispata]|uniref:Uncharacterized protein n=1 Tax=Elysia crispata TaxID=231223 RepID=A0AAE0XVZ5_9GAST|nr:hypothetical protein RRG08_040057 [Elysia crispata]
MIFSASSIDSHNLILEPISSDLSSLAAPVTEWDDFLTEIHKNRPKRDRITRKHPSTRPEYWPESLLLNLAKTRFDKLTDRKHKSTF